MKRKNRPEDGKHEYSRSYEGSDASRFAILSFSDSLGYKEVNGFISYGDGFDYSIDNCGRNCHVLRKKAKSSQGVKEAKKEIKPPELPYERVKKLKRRIFKISLKF